MSIVSTSSVKFDTYLILVKLASCVFIVSSYQQTPQSQRRVYHLSQKGRMTVARDVQAGLVTPCGQIP